MDTDEPASPSEWTATTRNGAISVRTTEQGLPLGISIDAAELRRPPDELAQEVLRLCRSAANRAGVARREALAAAGMSREWLALTGLPTTEEVAVQEISDEQEYDTEQESWLRPV
ncbi:hypothetical protein ACWF9G_00800 [Nocardia sp. NPDC055029]